MLINYIREGEQIASECRASKPVKGVKSRHLAWLRRVEKSLKEDPVALARFRNAQPVSEVPAGLRTELEPLAKAAQFVVLIELATGRDQQEVIALSPTLWHWGSSLKAMRHRLNAWWRNRRTLDFA